MSHPETKLRATKKKTLWFLKRQQQQQLFNLVGRFGDALHFRSDEADHAAKHRLPGELGGGVRIGSATSIQSLHRGKVAIEQGLERIGRFPAIYRKYGMRYGMNE